MRNIVGKEKLQEVGVYLEGIGLGPQANALKQCNIVSKPWWMPWKNLSTTLNNTIYLAKEWEKWDLSAHLAHEATHLLQQKEMGMAAFLASYAQKDGRLRLELEAHKVELSVYMADNPLANVPELENDIVRRLATNYAFGDWFNQERQWRAVKYLRGQ